jgi:allantoicase
MVEFKAAEEFEALVDLASRWLGAGVIAANDESFGAKENLINSGAADFTPGSYAHSGEIVDGWETRRRRGISFRGRSEVFRNRVDRDCARVAAARRLQQYVQGE